MSNPTVAEVIARFKSDRINREFLRQQQADSLPGMAEIKIRKKQLLKQMLLSAADGAASLSIENEMSRLDKKEKDLLLSASFAYLCENCRDTGFAGGTFCSCLRDEIYSKAYGAVDIASLEESFERSDKSRFDTGFRCVNGDTQQNKFVKIENYLKAYVKNYPDNPKRNLLLSGHTGLGKSFLLRAMAHALHSGGKDVLLINASELFSVFYQHRLGNDISLSLLSTCGILLLDDLGAEPATHNVTIEYFLDLLNKRIDANKHTVIATNLSQENIISRYGERVYSRLRFRELCDLLVFEGSDIRLK